MRLNSLVAAALCGIAYLCLGSATSAASFDCRKASTADEITICASPDLSVLDVINSMAFQQAKRIDRIGALTVARAHLRNRRACGYDAPCIKATFHASLAAYTWLGATVVTQFPSYSGVAAEPVAPQPVYPVVNVAQQQPAEDKVYYRNCTAARAAGAAPIYRGEPGYRPALDRDSDGVACE